eukprot:3595933-Alexandrium_andersonii.AAC.1
MVELLACLALVISGALPAQGTASMHMPRSLVQFGRSCACWCPAESQRIEWWPSAHVWNSAAGVRAQRHGLAAMGCAERR